MRIAAAGKGNIGIPVKVAKEFVAADKAKAKPFPPKQPKLFKTQFLKKGKRKS